MGKMPGLIRLNLWGKMTPKHWAGIVGSKIQELILAVKEIDADSVQSLFKIETLRKLAIPHTLVTPKGLEAVKNLPNLQLLELQNSKNLKEADIKGLSQAMPKLKIISDFGEFGPK